MPTRLQTDCALEVTVYNTLELLHKKMMSVNYSSTLSQKVDQAQLKKFPVFYSPIGHLERS